MFCPKCKGEMTRDDKGFYVCPDCGAKFRSRPPKLEFQLHETSDINYARSNSTAYTVIAIILFLVNLVLVLVTLFVSMPAEIRLMLSICNAFLVLIYTFCLIKAIAYVCIDEYDCVRRKAQNKTVKEFENTIAELQNRISALETTLVEFKANAEREKADVRNASETERE